MGFLPCVAVPLGCLFYRINMEKSKETEPLPSSKVWVIHNLFRKYWSVKNAVKLIPKVAAAFKRKERLVKLRVPSGKY